MALTISQRYWQGVVRASFGGQTFRASRRTFAHLRKTNAALQQKHPGCYIRIIQPCYSDPTIFTRSAGTHDEDCTLDVEIEGMSSSEAQWNAAQMFLRSHGWAAFYRTPAQGFGRHIHMISIPPGIATNRPTLTEINRGFTGRGLEVGAFVPAQVDDYYNHALGLKGQHDYGTDPSWHPTNIGATIFRPKGY